ncbi:DUF1631 domain-containing protein [Stenotrophomonas sp. YAU14D1_LEIMI4_1]|uniref:DUF1631 domain-containing protein n=1 Tax=Stenotrophomonas sp. YAU14D1_LEIMI4_1 TaxID=2072407 RepID=UPI000D53D9E2|nr:DUF1631 domain-containing protein [Stenotrophomonas sp. YAU14D1_LEIMI4_1]AWH24315.1 DUF1631 domain-containing protein [Stenotrophomonas sp. YAU14D1_LEIMI4_1]
MMSAPTPMGSPGRDPAQLQLARDMVLPALCQAFAAALARFDDALFDRAGNAGASQLLFLDAMRELRRRRAEIEAAYAGHLQRAWAALATGEPLSAEATLSGPAEEGLSLIPEHVLESRLAVRNFATVLLRDFKPMLARLDRRLGWLVGAGELDADRNPVSPEHLGVAIHEAFAHCELAPEVHLVLIKLCERDLRVPVGRIYEKLDEQLAAAGVMPQMGAPRRAPSAAPSRPPPGLDDLVEQRAAPGFDTDFSDEEQAAPAWAQRFAARWSERRGHMQQHLGEEEGPAGEGYGGQQGMLLEALHELLQQTRHVREDATSAAQVAVGQHRPLSQREMMSVLSLLQATPSATLRAAIGEDGESLAQRLKSEVLSSATRLGADPGQTRLDPQDEDAIDLVGMLFDVMLDERELEGRSRELIGRLVVPFVKVAMLDRRMFVQKTHPARKLLNSLAEACEGNTGESQAERMLMAKVEEIIERLVAEFNENLAIFLTLEEEFREFLVQHRRRVEIAERRAAETQRGQEKLEMARSRAGAELDRRIGDATLPSAIAEFLRQPWQHHLTLALLREGEEGSSVAEALSLGDGLLEEVAEARRQIVGKPWLQAWQPALAKVFASVGVHGDAASAAIDALHDTLQGIAESRPELQRALPELPQVALPTPPAPETAAVELGGQVDTDDFDNADADRFRRMEIGNWLDFVDKDGKVQAGKLSWVSPISSRLLFVNRRGVRFCVASPEELAVMVRLGRLRAHVDDGAFDSAMQGVIDRLDPGSATLH